MVESRRPWLGQALHIQSGVSTVLIGGVSLAALLGVTFGLGVQVAVLLAGLVVIGVPHGAFDHFVARPVLQRHLGRAWSVVFVAAYLGLAGLVGLGWIWAPQATLAVFLAATVLHFGLGDAEDGLAPAGVPRRLVVLVYGLLPVLLPVALHAHDAATVLAAMAKMSPDALEPLLHATCWLLPGWAAGFIWVTRTRLREHTGVAERLATAAGFVFLPPLLAFGLYFSLGHSVRHVLRLGAWHDPHHPVSALSWIGQVIAPAAITCAVGLACFAMVDTNVITGLIAPAFRVIASLTLPHMIVTSWLDPQRPADQNP